MKSHDIELLRYLCHQHDDVDKYWNTIKIANRKKSEADQAQFERLKGISTTQHGQEQYETFYSSHQGRRVSRRVVYDYRTQGGELFSVVALTLGESRRKRDEWLAKRNK